MLGPGNGHTEYSLRMLLGDEHLGATNSSFQRTAQVEKPRTAPLLLCPVAAVGVQELPLGGRAFLCSAASCASVTYIPSTPVQISDSPAIVIAILIPWCESWPFQRIYFTVKGTFQARRVLIANCGVPRAGSSQIPSGLA